MTDRLFLARPWELMRMHAAVLVFFVAMFVTMFFWLAVMSAWRGGAVRLGWVGGWTFLDLMEALEWVRLAMVLMTAPALAVMCAVPLATRTKSDALRARRWGAAAVLGCAWLGGAAMAVQYVKAGWPVPVEMTRVLLGGVFLLWCLGLMLLLPCLADVARQLRLNLTARVLFHLTWCVMLWTSAWVGLGVLSILGFEIYGGMWALVAVAGVGILSALMWGLAALAGALEREHHASDIYHAALVPRDIETWC
jgi:hypothetical protein